MTNNGLEAVEVWLSRPPGYFKMGFFDHHMPLVRIISSHPCLIHNDEANQIMSYFSFSSVTAWKQHEG